MPGDIRFRKLPPVWFIRILNSFRNWLLHLNRMMFPGNVVLYEQFQYLWLLPCIRAAAELNIAGILKVKPETISELAAATKSDPGNLFRMMRALTSQGIFKLRKDGRYVNTSTSKALIDRKGSMKYVLLQHLGSFNWITLSETIHTIRTGKDAVSKIYGKGIYDYLEDHPEQWDILNKSMSNLTELAIEPILSAYDFSSCGILADIGGGDGLLLSSILHENPCITGILYDRMESMIRAESIFAEFNVTGRITILYGNFFESVPSGARVYILKNILHNWSDEDCIKILGNIHKVLPDEGKILLIEMVISEDNKPSFGKLIDIQMMVFMNKGKERTVKEYETILARAGFRISKITPTIAPVSIIEAMKADK